MIRVTLLSLSKKLRNLVVLLLGLPLYLTTTNLLKKECISTLKAIADASDLPIIIYNIPGRVVVELTPETMLRLADHPNIIGVKECTSLANMAYLIEHKPEEFLVYTGEDGDAFHAMNLGADGVISVASHTNGDEMREMFTAIAESDMRRKPQLFSVNSFLGSMPLFSYPSPAPVRAVLNYRDLKLDQLVYLLFQQQKKIPNALSRLFVDGDYEATKATVTGV